jgi:4-hydroxy-2-oxovalerate/4-hydroxy-2-oxohexanoate aldolase
MSGETVAAALGRPVTRIRLHDMCLRDGMHPKRQQISIAQMQSIAMALDSAGVRMIEVTHGDGLGGASINYGFARHTDVEYIRAVVEVVKHARISALLIPGIGTADHLREAHDSGAQIARVATHCTEADVAAQHIALARKLGLDTVGFLMMAHMSDAASLAAEAKKMEDYGAQCVYCTDSAGYMLPEDVRVRVEALRAALRPETEIGFHGHHNLGMGVANSISAVQAGARRIDGSAAGLGAGAGNTPLEVFNAVCHRMGIETGVDVFKLADAAEESVVPIMDAPVRLDRDALVLGYAGVYSTFLLFAQRAASKYGIRASEILVEMGRLKTVGGQEDQIEDVAINLARANARGRDHARA